MLLGDTGNPDEACVVYAEAYGSRGLDKRPLRPSRIEAFKALDTKLPQCKKESLVLQRLDADVLVHDR